VEGDALAPRFTRLFLLEDAVRCYHCKEDLPVEVFGKNRTKRRGVQDYCRDCMTVAVVASHKKNPLWKAYKKQWAEKNKDKVAAHFKKWYAVAGRAFYKAHADAYREVKLAWAHRNREHCRLNSEAYRIRKIAAPGTLTKQQWFEVIAKHDWCCAYCGEPLNHNTLSMDHVIPLARGGSHEAANIVPACRACNASKGKKLLGEWTSRPSKGENNVRPTDCLTVPVASNRDVQTRLYAGNSGHLLGTSERRKNPEVRTIRREVFVTPQRPHAVHP
jgi:5-methylcytosine-specific restriction endonuclease McrA